MINENDFQKALELISNSNNVLVTTHTRPDGDACGSVAALCEALAEMDKKAQPLMLSEIPQWYEFLFDKKPAVLGDDITLEQLCEPDLIVIIDTNSYGQLPGFDEFLKQNDKPVLIIDHHVTSDNLGNVELIDASAAGAGLIVFDLFKYAGWTIGKQTAQALFVTVATDTGWFQFDNTDARAMRDCAELIETGLKPTQIYKQLYQNYSVERFKLMTVMLNTIEMHFDGRYVTQYLRNADFAATGAKFSDTENLIDECRRIAGVEAAAFFVELDNGKVKCSLRSQGDIDVRKIAQQFGGGGHTMASGATLPGPLEIAQKLIFDEIKKQFAEIDSK
ncbi:bifunctional oligoribonuclease/PAP phosphatase NrnA [Planctomycetota bacterium]